MTGTPTTPVVSIARAGTVHEIPVSKFLPLTIQVAANPSEPREIGISSYQDPDHLGSVDFCIHDKTQIMRQSYVDALFDSGVGEQKLDHFADMQVGCGRIYQPVMYFSGRMISDAIYEYLGEVATPSRKRGIARKHYNVVRVIMRGCGFAFIGAFHYSVESASSLLCGGARFLEEFVDPTILEPLFPPRLSRQQRIDGVVVADFLNRKDEKTLIHPELLRASMNVRLALLRRVKEARYLISSMESARQTDSTTATTGEVLDDMRERGIPLFIDFAKLDASTRLTKAMVKRQFGLLWDHVREIATLYTEAEIQEFIGWFN
jgi:hypothetical protein